MSQIGNVTTDMLVQSLRQRGQAYTYSIRWGSNGATAGIAQNGNSESSVIIDNGFTFIVDAFMFSAQSAAAGTPFSRGQEAAGTAPFLSGLRLALRDSKGPYSTQAGNDGVGLELMAGTAAQPFYPLSKYVISGGDTLFGKLSNFTATTVFCAELAIHGYRVRTNANGQ